MGLGMAVGVVAVAAVGKGVNIARGIDGRVGVDVAVRADDGKGVDAGPTVAVGLFDVAVISPFPHATRRRAPIAIISGESRATLTAAIVL